MEISFKDKIVLVTGSSRGIGKATLLEFARSGATVILNSRKQSKQTDSIVKEIADLGCIVKFIPADVTVADDVRHMKDVIEKEFGRLDVLVNNAGILRKEDVKSPNWKYWDELYETNLKGLARCGYELSSIMPSGSTIVNLASVFGYELPAYDANAYVALKAGVVSLTKSLALQLAPNIRVNAVAPGVVATEMLHEDDPQTKQWLQQNTPLTRAAGVDEVANLILFLASDKASYITGETVKVDGGLTLKI